MKWTDWWDKWSIYIFGWGAMLNTIAWILSMTRPNTLSGALLLLAAAACWLIFWRKLEQRKGSK